MTDVLAPDTDRMSELPRFSTHGDLRLELSSRQIQRLVDTNVLTRIRRGCYISAAIWSALSIDDKGALAVRAAAAALAPVAVLSHTSAAVLHGLPTGLMRRDRIHVTWPGSAGRGATSCVINHRSVLAANEISEIDGLRVTSPARTAYDLARSADPRLAVALIDEAIRRRLATAEDLQRCLDVNRGKPGSSRAARVFDFSDGLSESVGESITRVQFRQLGLPSAELQSPIVDLNGRVVARVDFLFADFRTAVEFDGKVKYEKFLRVGETAADVVYREKLREDAIRSTGLEVVRLVWRDHRDDAGVLARCRAAFARQGSPRWQPSPPGLIGWPTLLR